MVQNGGHPHWGVEFDWFGVDSLGHVGMFSTAGYGQVPLAVMPHVAELDSWFTRLDQLPRIGRCDDQPTGEGDFSDWVSAAERGLFGFDWIVWTGPYRRLAVPSDPIALDGLPDDLAQLARQVPLVTDFRAAATLDLADARVAVAPLPGA